MPNSSNSSDSSRPLFYVNHINGNCQNGNATVNTDGLSIIPGACAWIPAAPDRVWLCAAPDLACWGWNQPCTGGSDTAAGKGQTSCSLNGSSWCCSSGWEICSGLEGQKNVCWARTFDNPLVGIDPSSANATTGVELILRAQGVSISTPVQSPTTSQLPQSTPFGGPPSFPSAPPPNVTNLINSAHAKGAIVGSIIGAFIAIGLLLNAILYSLRWRNKRKAKRAVNCTSMDNSFESQRPLHTFDSANFPSRPRSRATQVHIRDVSKGGRQAQNMSDGSHEMKALPMTPPVDSPTVLSSTYSNRRRPTTIAEVYDDDHEKPTDLGGFVVFEAGRTKAERARWHKKLDCESYLSSG